MTTAISPSMVFVASHSPPRPTSTTATSTGVSAKTAYASATMTSKKDSLISLLGVDEIEVRRDLVVALDEAARRDLLAVDHDALGDVGQVRAGEAAGAQPERAQQLVDHARGRRLAVRPGEVDRPVGALRVAEQVEQRLDALAGGLHPALAPAGGDRRLDLRAAARDPRSRALVTGSAARRGRRGCGRCRPRRRRAAHAPSRPPAREPCR